MAIPSNAEWIGPFRYDKFFRRLTRSFFNQIPQTDITYHFQIFTSFSEQYTGDPGRSTLMFLKITGKNWKLKNLHMGAENAYH